MAARKKTSDAQKMRSTLPTKAEPAVPLDERISFVVHKINSRFTQIANQLLQPHDIGMYDARIMLFLLERKEMLVGELVKATALPQSTISHQLNRLRKRKLIRRRRSRRDNRTVVVELTPAGEEIALQSEKFSVYTQLRIRQHFSDDEIIRLNEMLNRVFELLTISEFNPDHALGRAVITRAQSSR